MTTTKVSRARTLAYQVLSKVERSGAFTNLALQQVFRQKKVELRDKALATEIVYGTIQRRRSLDALLQPYSSRSLSALDGAARTLLRMTAYQLGFLDKVPAYAAIHEAVELCKSDRPSAAGFVNGVLRAFSRDDKPVALRLQEAAAAAPSWADGIGILHSYPTWLVEALAGAYGRDRAVEILAASNDRAHLSVRVNHLRTDRTTLLSQLSDKLQDSVFPSQLSHDGVRLTKGLDVEEWAPYQEGQVTVQDEAAMLIAPLLQLDEHRTILDMCAAPGTKTTQIAEMQQDQGQITAVDLHQHKLDLLEGAKQRLGLHSITTVAGDARGLTLDPARLAYYDAILLDAPCSGLGVLRHRPDIRWRRTQEDVLSLQSLQMELLTTAAQLVRPGGVIVYSTCTLLPEENEQVVAAIVADKKTGLVWDDIRADLPEPLRQRVRDASSGLLITPDLYGTDGFYMARLKKTVGKE